MEFSKKMTEEDIRQLKIAQKKLTAMLGYIDKLCLTNNIEYFVIAGTCLGTAVYKGFIPWDGDIDIEINEHHFDRFSKLIQQDLPSNYFYQTKETDKLYTHRIKAKLRENYSHIEKKWGKKHSSPQHGGIYIDIGTYYFRNEDQLFMDDAKSVNYLNVNDIYPLKKMKFENIEVNMINNYNKYLSKHYNERFYLDLPINKRKPTEGKIIGHIDNPPHKNINHYNII